MSLRYLRAPGVLIAELGDFCAAYSSLSGETHLVNDETAQVLDLLDEHLPRSEAELGASLAGLYEGSPEHFAHLLSGSWNYMLEAGLILQSR
jgi:hypothetical protein